MKKTHLFQKLKEIAEKLEIEVLEHNFRPAGISVKSGLCSVKGKKKYIIDKHKRIKEKTELLASCLSKQEINDIYIIPAVREYLDKF